VLGAQDVQFEGTVQSKTSSQPAPAFADQGGTSPTAHGYRDGQLRNLARTRTLCSSMAAACRRAARQDVACDLNQIPRPRGSSASKLLHPRRPPRPVYGSTRSPAGTHHAGRLRGRAGDVNYNAYWHNNDDSFSRSWLTTRASVAGQVWDGGRSTRSASRWARLRRLPRQRDPVLRHTNTTRSCSRSGTPAPARSRPAAHCGGLEHELPRPFPHRDLNGIGTYSRTIDATRA